MPAYESSRYAYEGTEITETTVVRTGGAQDPSGQQQSRKIVTTANAQWLRPYRAEYLAVWNGTVGADVTVTVCGAISSYELPNNDDIWIEVSYLGDAASTLGKIVTTTKADFLATGVPVSSDDSSWPEAVMTFDAATTVSVTLSGGNLIATATGAPAGVKGLGPRFGGKWYFEVTANQVTGGPDLDNVVGLVTAAGTFSHVFAGYNSAAAFSQDGIIWSNNTTVGGDDTGFSVGSYDNGATISVAVDFENEKVWFRNPGIHWNGVALASSNPATNTGGVTLGGAADDWSPSVWFNAGAGGSVTANFGATAFIGAVPSGFTAGWNPTSTTFAGGDAVDVTLSNGNLTVTHANTNINAGAVAAAAADQATGKFYFEFTFTDVSTEVEVGITTGETVEHSSSVACSSEGGISRFASGTGAQLGKASPGITIGIAADFDNEKIWFRRVESFWNGHPDHDPVTNVGGVSISNYSGTTMAPYVGFRTSGDNSTINFGTTSYVYTPPAGFANWGAMQRFKLETTLSAPQPGLAGYLEARVRVGRASTTYYIDPQITLS